MFVPAFDPNRPRASRSRQPRTVNRNDSARAALNTLHCTRCGDPVLLHETPTKAPSLGCPRDSIAAKYSALTLPARRAIDAAVIALTSAKGSR